MKILCVSPSYWPAFKFGGPIQSLHLLNKYLVKDGVDLTVYTTNVGLGDNIDVNKETLIDGIKVIYFSFSDLFEFFGTTGWQFSYSLRSALKKNLSDFDLVYILSIWNFPTAVTAYYCRKYNIPYIISPRGHLYDFVISKKSWKKKPYYSLISRRDIRSASAIHYTTVDEYNNVHKNLGLDNKSFVVPNGFDLNDFESIPKKGEFRKKYSYLRDKKVVIFLGRISWKKGLDLLVDSLPDIIAKYPDLHVLIAGNDEDEYSRNLKSKLDLNKIKYSDSISDLEHKEGKQDHFLTFTGFLDFENKVKALVDSDLFVLPSYSENFGMSVIEAMICETPVLITDKVGIAGDIEKNNAGIVTKCDIKKISEAIINFFSNEEKNMRLVENAKKLVKSEYDIRHISKKMINNFRVLLK